MYSRVAGRGVLQTTIRDDRGNEEETEIEEKERNKTITFDDILENCFRYLNINDPEKVLDMTPNQYGALMRGFNYKLIDKQYEDHRQAWLNQQVKATKSKGSKGKSEPVYKTFNKFFDYEREIKKMENRFNKYEIPKTKVDNFRESVKMAELILNGGESFVDD